MDGKSVVVKVVDPEWLEDLDDELFEAESLSKKRVKVAKAKARDEQKAKAQFNVEPVTE